MGTLSQEPDTGSLRGAITFGFFADSDLGFNEGVNPPPDGSLSVDEISKGPAQRYYFLAKHAGSDDVTYQIMWLARFLRSNSDQIRDMIAAGWKLSLALTLEIDSLEPGIGWWIVAPPVVELWAEWQIPISLIFE